MCLICPGLSCATYREAGGEYSRGGQWLMSLQASGAGSSWVSMSCAATHMTDFSANADEGAIAPEAKRSHHYNTQSLVVSRSC